MVVRLHKKGGGELACTGGVLTQVISIAFVPTIVQPTRCRKAYATFLLTFGEHFVVVIVFGILSAPT